jgi:uracil-DNA glycosylase family 4
MHPARRLEYLQALGIDVWVPRAGTAAAELMPASVAAEQAAGESAGAEVSAVVGAEMASPASVADAGTSRTRASASRTAELHIRAGSEASAQPAAAPRAAPVPFPPLSTPEVALSPEVEAQWESLRTEVLSCTKCSLHATRTQGVFGVGNRRADWLIIGEAPGAEEDRQGEPFVGRAGQLLNAMLRAIGLQRESVFIANILKSRPPNNRDPKPDEVAACLPYLMRQIALLRPKLILAVGRIAAQNLLATDASLARLRGQVHTFGELNTPLIVTYHPAYLLRTPADKRKAWEDLKFARNVFRRLASQES